MSFALRLCLRAILRLFDANRPMRARPTARTLRRRSDTHTTPIPPPAAPSRPDQLGCFAPDAAMAGATSGHAAVDAGGAYSSLDDRLGCATSARSPRAPSQIARHRRRLRPRSAASCTPLTRACMEMMLSSQAVHRSDHSVNEREIGATAMAAAITARQGGEVKRRRHAQGWRRVSVGRTEAAPASHRVEGGMR